MAKTQTAFLTQLNIVESLPARVNTSIRSPRARFLQKIQEQLAILSLLKEGKTPQQQRIWFSKVDDDIFIQVKYGNRPVMLMDNKLVLKASTWDEAEQQVDMVMKAVEAGELDEELARITKVNRKSGDSDE